MATQLRTKSDAVALFGSQTAIARALGVTIQAVHQWNEELSLRQQNELLGAALRAGLLRHKKPAA